MKILTVVGARPQFVKAAVVSQALQTNHDCAEVLVHTGQHYDDNMSEVFFKELGIPAPSINLGIGSGGHGEQTGRMLQGLEEAMTSERPDWVLIYGDTNSTLAGALAAVKLHIPVAHVEAGLRSFNRRMPEEINRVVADHVSDLLLAPTEVAVTNLRREGLQRVELVGDVMYDAALYFGRRAEKESKVLERMNLAPKKYILVTIHRAENTDDPARLRAVFNGLENLASEYQIIAPLHPRTRNALEREGLWSALQNKLRFCDPVGYLDMARLEASAALIVTDSGGVQKEAFFHSVGCVTLRDETEWTELVDLNWNRVVPPVTAEKVMDGIRQSLSAGPGQEAKPYGEGNAAQRIAACLVRGV